MARVRRFVMGRTVLLELDDSTAELTADDSVLAEAMLARGLRPVTRSAAQNDGRTCDKCPAGSRS